MQGTPERCTVSIMRKEEKEKSKNKPQVKKNAVEEEIGKMKAWKATQLESCMNTALKNAEAFEAKAEKLVVVKFIMEAQM